MADRKATFAKRQRETELKDRAKAKDDRRAQKRAAPSAAKGPQIAWDEAVHAVTTDENELPALDPANQDGPPPEAQDDYSANPTTARDDRPAAPGAPTSAPPRR